jgi:hypothetical protein
MAGLILKMAYEIEFIKDDALTNTMNKISKVVSAILTTNFVVEFPTIQQFTFF